MATVKKTFRAPWAPLRGAFIKLATGGEWALTQPAATRRNLVWFWCDGLFASASDSIIGTYLVIYILAMGATQTQIGLMSSLSSLMAAISLLPGAMLVERIGRRRGIILLGGGWARFALLFLALLPFFIKAPWIILVAIAFSVSRDFMANLSFPAWMSMTADIVPLEGRGRFFSSRNFVMGLSGMIMTLSAGLLISHTVQPLGYQVALGVAFAIGSLSIFSFAHLTDQPVLKQAPVPVLAIDQADAAEPAPKQSPALWMLLREIAGHREYMFFMITTAIWNFSLNIAGPFFTVYLVKNLHADGTMIALTSIASSLASLLVQRKMGELNDRWGSRRLTMISGLLIPIVPVLWIFTTAAWHVILINLLSGVLWGAYGLASFNYLLQITPGHRLARYSAFFQITVTVSLAVGAAIGSLVVNAAGFHAVFLWSGVGRLVAALLLAWLLTTRRSKPSVMPV